VLGVQPMLGRPFLREEVTPRPARVIILSHEIWRELGARNDIVGTAIRLNGEAFTVVGVMPPIRYSGPFIGLAEVWTPQPIDPAAVRERKSGWRGVQVLGRIRNGVDLVQVERELTAVHRDLAVQYPEVYRDFGVVATPLEEFAAGDAKKPLLVLSGAVIIVLLIACANASNLLLVQAANRRREVALRAALGATPRRLTRQFVVESAVLASVAAAAGLLLGWSVLRVIAAYEIVQAPQLAAVSLDFRVFVAALGFALVATLVCGSITAMIGSRRDPASLLRGGRTLGGGHEGSLGRRLRHALVVTEIALAFALVVGAGLLVRTFRSLMRVDAGFRAEHVLTFDVTLPTSRYPKESDRVVLMRELQRRLGELPGIEGVGANRYFPLRARQYSNPVTIEGRATAPGTEPIVQYGGVTSGYFEALGIRVLDGRTFTDGEMWQEPGAVIVNERMARELWPGESVLGRRIRLANDPRWLTVVGVVSDVKQRRLDEPAAPQVYVPYSDFEHTTMTFAVRARQDPRALTPAVTRTLRGLDPGLPAFNVMTLDELMARSASGRRLAMQLLTALASIALALAVMGVASTMSYTVAQTTSDIGVRMALGAERSVVLRMVLSQGAGLATAGLAAGALLALVGAQLMRALLFGVGTTDPLSIGLAALVLLVVVLGASLVPAYRAARVDPITALRAEV
jgi:predicted permease